MRVYYFPINVRNSHAVNRPLLAQKGDTRFTEGLLEKIETTVAPNQLISAGFQAIEALLSQIVNILTDYFQGYHIDFTKN